MYRPFQYVQTFAINKGFDGPLNESHDFLFIGNGKTHVNKPRGYSHVGVEGRFTHPEGAFGKIWHPEINSKDHFWDWLQRGKCCVGLQTRFRAQKKWETRLWVFSRGVDPVPFLSHEGVFRYFLLFWHVQDSNSQALRHQSTRWTTTRRHNLFCVAFKNLKGFRMQRPTPWTKNAEKYITMKSFVWHSSLARYSIMVLESVGIKRSSPMQTKDSFSQDLRRMIGPTREIINCKNLSHLNIFRFHLGH